MTVVNPLSLWGGGNCPVGFQFQASATAKIQTGANFNGRWNLNECFNNPAGFTGGEFGWGGISAALKVKASAHGFSFEVGTDVIEFVEGNSWPL